MLSCNGEDRDCVFGQHYPTRKRADFHLVAHHEKVRMGTSDANHFQEGKQMTAGYGLAGAPSGATKVHIVAPS
jgi:hypothetical protein